MGEQLVVLNLRPEQPDTRQNPERKQETVFVEVE